MSANLGLRAASILGFVLFAVACSATRAPDAANSTTSNGGEPFEASSIDEEAGIRKTLSAYNAALNAGKTADVLPLYTEDGIFMPPFSQSAIGVGALTKAYEAVFRELAFNVNFEVAEVVVMAPTWAYVRTNSAGTTRHASTGKTTAEANQELFIFKKGTGGVWRISRYSFSPTKPPSA